MDNGYYRSQCERIEAMGLEELRREIRDLEAAQADPYPDDDLAGDIAVSNWLSLAQRRLRELEGSHASV